jgi:V/A-type H+/Na+-transporting ATPase subunit F
MEITVIGTSNSVTGFCLAGIKSSHCVANEEELINKINEAMANPEIGIMVLIQADYDKLPKRIQTQLSDAVRPTVIAIGTEQSQEMREKIKRAIGVDLWK